MKKKYIAIIAMISVFSLAGCGSSKSSSKSGKDNTDNAVLNELDEDEKKEIKEAQKELEAEMNKESAKNNTNSKADEASEDLGLKDPKYYTYYEDLAKSYAESDINSYGGSYFYTVGISDPVYINNKVYLSSTGSDKAILYSYDIAGGALEKVFSFNSKETKDKYSYDSWFIKGDDMYLLYRETVYGDDHIEKVGKDGNVIEDYDITEGSLVNQISYVFDNGKILLNANGDSSFEIYDPAEKKLTQLDVIPVPSDHAGVTQDADRPIFLFAKGNSFYFGNKQSSFMGGPYISDNTIYEYDTDKGEASVFYTDDLLRNEDPAIKIFGDYLMIEYKSVLDRTFSVIDLNDGSKIVDNERSFSPYLGGDGSCYREIMTKKWYKLRYPDSTYEGTFDKVDALIEAGEELSDDDTDTGNVIQLNDKYYVCRDDAGYFLRTYEKGSADEQLIITKQQIDEDLQN